MKSKILKELKNADDYISGQQLCERLGVSRTAVWKHIKALRAEGYEIDSVTNKGYKLMMEPDLLIKEEVASCLHTKCRSRNRCDHRRTDDGKRKKRTKLVGRSWSRDRDELSSKTSDRSSEFFYAYVSYCISGK